MNKPQRIPMIDLHSRYVADEGIIKNAVQRVLKSGRYILDKEVNAFEREFAAYLGSAHCVAVASGTDALALALRACGLAPGDEVITVANSAAATVAAVEQAGGVPVLVDVDPETRCMDPGKLEALITSQTRIILPVHLYGFPAPVHEICRIAERHGLKVVEDCAQAHGASIGSSKIGTLGDAGAFSFYPTKNLGALGDAGAVVTRRAPVCEQLRQLRQYGWDEKRECRMPGVNSRMDEIQAAILRARLPGLDRANTRRRYIADRYRETIDGVSIGAPPKPAGATEAAHLFVVESDMRDGLRAFLSEAGIDTAIHYPLPIHRQAAYRQRLHGADQLPESERLCSRIVSLPLYPEMTDAQVTYVCDVLRQWMVGQ